MSLVGEVAPRMTIGLLLERLGLFLAARGTKLDEGKCLRQYGIFAGQEFPLS